MKRTVLFALIILSFTLSLFPQETADKKEHVVYIDHSRDNFINKTHSRLSAKDAERNKLEWNQNDFSKARLEKQSALTEQRDDIAEIAAVNISAITKSLNSTADHSGDFLFMGEVLNTGSTPACFIKINVNMYNSSNVLLDTKFTYVFGGSVVRLLSGGYTNALRANETGFFKLYTSVPYSDVDRITYTFAYSTRFAAFAKASLSFKGTPTTSNSSGDLKLVGEIQNNSSTHLTYFTKVYFSIRNSSGKVLDLALIFANGTVYDTGVVETDTAIEPGSSASFRIFTNVPYSQYSSYKYSFEFSEVQVVSNTTYKLSVKSTPNTGAGITVTPNDNSGKGDGNTDFTRSYDEGTAITLTAPLTHNGNEFVRWNVDGATDSSRTINITMNRNHTATAEYKTSGNTVTYYTLTVDSSPTSDVYITVSPKDNNGLGSGYSSFSRSYKSGTTVTLKANPTASGMHFSKWTVDGKNYSSNQINIKLAKDIKATARYTSSPPKISLNREELYFSYVLGGRAPKPQTFSISNIGSGTLNWSIADGSDVQCSPDSGTGDAIINVNIDPTGCSAGNYYADLEVSDSSASNSPKNLRVYLEVKYPSADQVPIGDFSTPLDGSTVRSSIPVTGWVVDDTDIESVKIYREEGNNLVFVGDAVFVEGARPDIETAFPTYPASYKAGWGYMLLTLYLPNGGNGTYTLHAIAADTGGHQTSLGTKTITCDNANAVEPFGAIDTPLQGGSANGSSFINWGWVLTPQPNNLPTDGSSINVWVNGVNLGNPKYNFYREDIATFFPGYFNTNGAVGYFILDTTGYPNGIHSIQWTARDSGGNSDGIGSRFFTIDNTKSTRLNSNNDGSILQSVNSRTTPPRPATEHYGIPGKTDALSASKPAFINRFKIRELERIQVELSELLQSERLLNSIKTGIPGSYSLSGYLLVGDKFKPLPVGSTLNQSNATFSWFPGHSFFGSYHLVFIARYPDGTTKRKDVVVDILPRHEASK